MTQRFAAGQSRSTRSAGGPDDGNDDQVPSAQRETTVAAPAPLVLTSMHVVAESHDRLPMVVPTDSPPATGVQTLPPPFHS